MALEDRIIQLFLKQDSNCSYTGEWIEDIYNCHCHDDWFGKESLFTSYDSAYAYAVKQADKKTVEPRFRVSKHFIDNAESKSFCIDVYYNSSGEMISIDFAGVDPWTEHEKELLFERFDDMWFDIPIPFMPGDIVWNRYKRIPFVITTTVHGIAKSIPKRMRKTIFTSQIWT